MATEAVDIYINDDGLVPQPILDVFVGIYDQTTFDLVASAVTVEDGRAAFVLTASADPGTQYEVRLFKLGVLFRNPFAINVISPLGVGQTNRFDVYGHPRTVLASSDPNCCRCTGTFVDFSNRPLSGVILRVTQRTSDPVPKVINGNAVGTQGMTFRTSGDGYVSFDLVRGSEYLVILSSDEDDAREIVVPDRDSVNLVDLMYPFPVALDWDDTVAPGNVVSLAVGESLTVPFTVLFSSFEVRAELLGAYVDITIADSSFLEAAILDGSVVLTGMGSGTTTATPERKSGLKPEIRPVPDFDAPILSITVTA